MSGCCSSDPRDEQLSVHACFERGLATRRLPLLAIAGQRITTTNGLWAAFTLRTDAGHLREIRFTACTCTTLIACCQALAELNQGRRLDTARGTDSQSLIASLPGMPRARHDRAALAATAFRAALAATNESPEPGDPA